MSLKSRHEDLINLIGHIKNDKVGISSYKKLDSYYKLMYEHLPSKNIVDFINGLTTIPVNEYVDNIEYSMPLLNEDGSLNTVWNDWHIKMTSVGNLDDSRFNLFREKCFELSEVNMEAADELYRVTRTFIIENTVLEDSKELDFVFMNTRILIPYSYRKIALEYIRDAYNILKTPATFNICDKCGYVKSTNDKVIIHRLCKPNYKERLLPTGSLILKPEIYYAITNPGRFEYDVHNNLLKEGFRSIIFPEIEKSGDVYVEVCGDGLYLDMKAYNYSESLYSELVNEWGKLKEKYQKRWIIVPDLYYQEQLEYIGDLLRSGGSRLYNISDLLEKLKRMEKEGK